MLRVIPLSLALLCAGVLSACKSGSEAGTAGAPANEVKLEVTEQGFIPASFDVAASKPVTLHVTRKTDKTCATEIVIKEYGINQPLPLGQEVTVSFTPRPGAIHFACAMDMITGTITAR